MAPAKKSMSLKKSKPSKKAFWKRPLVWVGIILGVLLVGAGAFVGLVYYYISDPNLPKLDKVSDYRPRVTTHILDRNGVPIGEIFVERRTVVPYEEISDTLIYAVIDAEDAQFFQHKGLSYLGMLRAFVNNLKPGSHLQGASTITQQLVKLYVLQNNERSARRKIQEAYLAVHLENRLDSKEHELFVYLNHVYLGHQRFGMEEAAQYYFGKSIRKQAPNQLTVAEAAILASLLKSPAAFSPQPDAPSQFPERTRARQKYVLSQMLRYGHITETQKQQAEAEPIVVAKHPDFQHLAPEFVDEVEKELRQRYTEAELPYAGLTVRTTCDIHIQQAARAALEKGLQRIDERAGYLLPVRHLDAKQQETHLKKLDKEFPNGAEGVDKAMRQGKVIEGLVQQVFENNDSSLGMGAKVALGKGNWGWLKLPKEKSRNRYNPKGLSATARFKAGDVVRVRMAQQGKEGLLLQLESGPQGAVVVLDPDRRHVLAMVGGYEYGPKQFNRALRAKRQPGSAFKAIVYAAAFASKQFTPATLMADSPQVFEKPGMHAYKPKNAESHGFAGFVRLRTALAQSYNTIAVQLVERLTFEPVISMARAMGIESPLRPEYPLALGAFDVTPLELINAYATLAARGRLGQPLFVVQIDEQPPQISNMHESISPDVAFQMTSVLQSVIEEGTAKAAKGKLKQPAAGKTGTTNSRKDAWFVGYTPDLVTGVWVGFDDASPMGEKEYGAKAALPIWLETMQAAVKGHRTQTFAQPAGVVMMRIDPQTGKQAASKAPFVEEVFLEGTQPTEQALAPGETNPDTFNMNDD